MPEKGTPSDGVGRLGRATASSVDQELLANWNQVSPDQWDHVTGRYKLLKLSTGAVVYRRRGWFFKSYEVTPKLFGSVSAAVQYVMKEV